MEAPVIYTLPQRVVDRIAAGEVIHRTASAVKELLENSLDAGASEIDVRVGVDGFQIRDDGRGIRFEDVAILCRRHTTSKLKTFEDLNKIQTLGFRGEALCSVSHVGRVTVTTRPATSAHGIRVDYADGAMLGDPISCPSMPGTTICVTDLFVNRSTGNSTEDLSEMEILKSYALHCVNVGFVVKKADQRSSEICVKKSDGQLDRISRIFGCDLAKNVIRVEKKWNWDRPVSVKRLTFRFDGWISNADYSGRRRVFVLFINDRYVQCGPLKRAVDGVYASVLPKRMPFVYVSLQLPFSHVDVNVHPTKREVEFLFKQQIIQSLTDTIRQMLTNSNHGQTLKTSPAECLKGTVQRSSLELPLPGICTGKSVQDSKDRMPDLEKESTGDSFQAELQNYISEMRRAVHLEARELILGHQFVGMTQGRHAFVQFQNGLYMMDMESLSRDFFCQLVWNRIGHHDKSALEPPLMVRQLLEGCLESAECDHEQISKLLTALMSKRQILKSLLSVEICEEGYLVALPQLLESLPPQLHKLPRCFNKMARALHEWSGDIMEMAPLVEAIADIFTLTATDPDADNETLKALVHHKILPAMRDHYFPSHKRIKDRSIVKLTTIENLCPRFGR